jgi:phospholipase C
LRVTGEARLRVTSEARLRVTGSRGSAPGLLSATLLLLAAVPAGAQSVTFKHVVIVVQENRTPDNLFGAQPNFEPGVDISRTGVNSLGQTIHLQAEALASCYDISHAHAAFETMLNQGADLETVLPGTGCHPPANPQFKYADNSTGIIQPYFDLATGYGFANRMFQTNQGPSFPAHQFLFGGTSQPQPESPLFASENMTNTKTGAGCTAPAGQTVSLIDATGSETSNAPIFPCFEHNTLADLLDAANLSWRYYAAGATGIWTAPNAIRHICLPTPSRTRQVCSGAAWTTSGNVYTINPAQVLTDIQSCKLAAVSWVTPTSDESDHAGINNATGPQWVASIVNAVGQQPNCAGETYWNDTAILITWDDWGGWYDHVAPFANNSQPGAPPSWGQGYTYGFRVPLLVVSAYTAKGTVDNATHDFGSLLAFVEHNFGLGFIGAGNSLYSTYADAQAVARGDTLAAFFTKTHPRPFTPIAVTLGATYFKRAPVNPIGPDND